MAITQLTIQAEDLTLSTAADAPFVPYVTDTRLATDIIRVDGDDGDAALATTAFSGDSGVYNVTVKYIDENDGNSTAALFIGDIDTLTAEITAALATDPTKSIAEILAENNSILTWVFDNNNSGTSFQAEQEIFNGLSIRNGDDIAVVGVQENGELARIDALEFDPVISGELEFSTTSAAIAEDGGSVTLTITRSDGSLGAASATLNVAPGTGVDATDFTLGSSTVEFAEGETTKTVTVAIADDTVDESDETLTISLAPVVGQAVIGVQDTFTLTIIDNDEPAVTPSPNPPTTPTPTTPTPTTPTPTTPTPTTPTPTTPTPTTPTSPIGQELTGTDGFDRIQGTQGDDVIDARAGNDIVLAGAGDDTVSGGAGRDLINGGKGNDTLDGGSHRDLLNGGKGNDTLEGGSGGDALNGGAGDDVLRGGRGRDRLYGGRGNDELDGGQGRDFLVGGDGDDLLSGGQGRDILTGGKGEDTFILTTNPGVDRITDFEVGTDRFELGSGLTFDDLEIVQRDGGAVISVNGDRIAILEGVDASLITDTSVA